MAAAFGIFFMLVLIGSVVAQFLVGAKLNKTRKQSHLWWVWVVCLGWIGVIIIACQSPAPAPQIVYVTESQNLSN